jgi:hypothetical protein
MDLDSRIRIRLLLESNLFLKFLTGPDPKIQTPFRVSFNSFKKKFLGRFYYFVHALRVSGLLERYSMQLEG